MFAIGPGSVSVYEMLKGDTQGHDAAVVQPVDASGESGLGGFSQFASNAMAGSYKREAPASGTEEGTSAGLARTLVREQLLGHHIAFHSENSENSAGALMVQMQQDIRSGTHAGPLPFSAITAEAKYVEARYIIG